MKKVVSVGEKIRKLRGNMTQAELARRTGIDKAIISKMETGKMTGTVESHRKLAKVFGLKLSEFYAYLEEEHKPEPAEMHPGNTKTDFYGDFLEILTTLPLSRKMLPTFISLKPGEEVYLEETLKKAERFIMIIEGKVEVEIEKHIYVLKKDGKNEKGDSLYSTSPRRHRIKNTGGTKAKLICVSAPPVL